MNYPVAERALKKWNNERLETLSSDEGVSCYRFHYEGSTCRNGGQSFNAFFHIEIDDSTTVRKAWIEIPKESETAACQMCVSPSKEPDKARDFLGRLAKDADFTGRKLEDVILEDQDLNYAGCLCHKPMIDQKWKMVLSTVHYNINKE